MKTNKFIKVTVTVFTLFVILWFAVPSIYTANLFSYKGSSLLPKTETKVETQGTSDMDYKKPVYFNIFKFVTDLIPGKK